MKDDYSRLVRDLTKSGLRFFYMTDRGGTYLVIYAGKKRGCQHGLIVRAPRINQSAHWSVEWGNLRSRHTDSRTYSKLKKLTTRVPRLLDAATAY